MPLSWLRLPGAWNGAVQCPSAQPGGAACGSCGSPSTSCLASSSAAASVPSIVSFPKPPPPHEVPEVGQRPCVICPGRAQADLPFSLQGLRAALLQPQVKRTSFPISLHRLTSRLGLGLGRCGPSGLRVTFPDRPPAVLPAVLPASAPLTRWLLPALALRTEPRSARASCLRRLR